MTVLVFLNPMCCYQMQRTEVQWTLKLHLFTSVLLGWFLQHWLLLNVRSHKIGLTLCQGVADGILLCSSQPRAALCCQSREQMCEWQGGEDLNGASCWVMLGFQTERGIVAMPLYPWFGSMTPHLARTLRSQLGLSGLMAPLMGFKAGELVQSKWDVHLGSCICWASVMIYVVTCEVSKAAAGDFLMPWDKYLCEILHTSDNSSCYRSFK